MKTLRKLPLGLFVVVACLFNIQQPASAAQPMVVDLSEKTGKAVDTTFLQMMIQHHKDGIQMAKLAVAKAKHDELKKFAEKMISDQGTEIKTMTDWLQAEGIAPKMDNMPPSAMKKMQADMDALSKASGDDFDRMFLSMMKDHHSSAVAMAKIESKKGQEEKVVTFAKEIESKQETEIRQLQSWQEKWFPQS